MPDKRKIYFRADGNSEIGMGHFIRTLALAEMLNEHFNCIYATRKPTQYQIYEIEKVCQGRIDLPEDDSHFEVFLNHIQGNEIVVLDNYYFTTKYQAEIKAKGCKLVCIDDLHDKEYLADLIINHAPGITKEDYNAQTYTQFALGFEYALLRPPFLEQVKIHRDINKFESLMICFGGSDFKNLTENTLEVVLKFSIFRKIIVVTGAAYRETDEFKKLVISDHRIEYRHALGNQQMFDTMLEVELAIIPASGILFEVICCGCIPLICYYAENQKSFHDYFVYLYKTNSFGDNTMLFQENKLRITLASIVSTIRLNNYTAIKTCIGGSREKILNSFKI